MPSAVAIHQICRSTRSAAALPGSSGGSPSGRHEADGDEAADRPEQARVRGVDRRPAASCTPSKQRGEADAATNGGERGEGNARKAVRRLPRAPRLGRGMHRMAR